MDFKHKSLVASCDKLYEDFDYKSKGLEPRIDYLFEVKTNAGTVIGNWYFSGLPGCCGVVVSHGLYLKEEYRGMKLSGPMQELREAVARKLGYSAMLATVVTNNFAEVISSAKHGWKLGPTFKNKERTGNEIAFQIKLLNL